MAAVDDQPAVSAAVKSKNKQLSFNFDEDVSSFDGLKVSPDKRKSIDDKALSAKSKHPTI
jgi:methionine-rich copper-binding protein CopC